MAGGTIKLGGITLTGNNLTNIGLNNSTNNTLNVDISGNTGICTTSPQSLLHQQTTTTGATNYHQFTSSGVTSTGSTSGLKIGLNSGGTAEIKQQENFDVVIYNNNIERFRISNTDNIYFRSVSTGLTNIIDTHGNIVMPKTSGTGMMVDTTTPTFGWRDILGPIVPKSNGITAPSLNVFRGGNIQLYSFMAGDIVENMVFHMPHDYVPNTDIYLHIHWSHNGTAISGSFVINYYIIYSKGHNQSIFNTEINSTQTISTPDITTIPRYSHQIHEFQLSNSTGDTSHIATNILEPDGLVIVYFVTTTIPTITGGSPNQPFMLMLDLHYQSTSMATKNKAPNFYT